MIPSYILASLNNNSLYAVTGKMYVCRYLSAVKPLVASQRKLLYFARGGIIDLEDRASLQIPV
jgi:hypothetical protein